MGVASFREGKTSILADFKVSQADKEKWESGVGLIFVFLDIETIESYMETDFQLHVMKDSKLITGTCPQQDALPYKQVRAQLCKVTTSGDGQEGFQPGGASEHRASRRSQVLSPSWECTCLGQRGRTRCWLVGRRPASASRESRWPLSLNFSPTPCLVSSRSTGSAPAS